MNETDDKTLQDLLISGNQALLEVCVPEGFAQWGVRAKIAWATMTRLQLDNPHKSAIKAALAHFICRNPLVLPKLLWETADAIWRFVGDTSVDAQFYSKRAIYAGIYAQTRLVWLEDTSANNADTRLFLEKALELIPLIGKVKQAQAALNAATRACLGQLGRWRYAFFCGA